MLTFPDEFLGIMIRYAALFSKPVFAPVQLLLAGAILAPGKRTITSVLRITGLGQEQNYHKYHRVLSLARRSARKGACILLNQLLDCFLPQGPVVVGLDETLERRWGSQISKRGIYRDAVGSSGAHFVKSSGLELDKFAVALAYQLGWANRGFAFSDRTSAQ